jgi:hypothetical protein
MFELNTLFYTMTMKEIFMMHVVLQFVEGLVYYPGYLFFLSSNNF